MVYKVVEVFCLLNDLLIVLYIIVSEVLKSPIITVELSISSILSDLFHELC